MAIEVQLSTTFVLSLLAMACLAPATQAAEAAPPPDRSQYGDPAEYETRDRPVTVDDVRILVRTSELLAQLPTRTQMDELLKAVKHLEQMNEQAGKRNEKRFSLPRIRLPRLRLPHLDGPTWAALLMGTAALLLLWWGLGTVWSNLSLMLQ